MPRLKRTTRKPQKQPRALIQPVAHSPSPPSSPVLRTTTRTRNTPSLPPSSPVRHRNRNNSAIARTKANALHDASFHTDPTHTKIRYSDEEKDNNENNSANATKGKGKKTDSNEDEDDANRLNSDEEETAEDDDEEDSDEDDEDIEYKPPNGNDSDDSDDEHKEYAALLDSSLLDDDEPAISYRVDWVKGKGAGRKPSKGRPPKPDTTNMNPQEAKEALGQWAKAWKKERDKVRRKNVHGNGVDGCSFSDASVGYTGCITSQFRLMTEVAEFPLAEGQTFPDKDTLLIRIGEEANLYGVRTKIVRSDAFQVDVRGMKGDPFHVLAYYGTNALRWRVTKCSTRSGRQVYSPLQKKKKNQHKTSIPPVEVTDLPAPDPTERLVDAFDVVGGLEEGNPDELSLTAAAVLPTRLDDSSPDKMAKKARLKSPIKSKWIVPLVHNAIAERPNLSSKEIANILKPYVIDIFLTYALIVKVRRIIRNTVFGDPDKNVTYIPALVERLEEGGHDFDVFVKPAQDVRKRLFAVVLEEKMTALKKSNKTMGKIEKLSYLAAWENANKDMLEDVGLGKNCSMQVQETNFVTGVFLSLGPAKTTVPLLQKVYQADAAHMNFGKYTLYSCYGITANCNAFPVALGIIFGNEDKEGWSRFWTFAKTRHPSLNQPDVTIITDQQKGSIEAMEEVLPQAVNFFCSYHRKKNIRDVVKGGVGEYSCHWYYELLLSCGRMETITKHKFDLAQQMDDKALAYISLVNDYQQFPAARVAHGAQHGVAVYMYQRSSSSTAESMNAANKAARDRTAVDPINSLILLLKMESKRFCENRDEAWEWKDPLTPHGKKLSEKVFRKVNARDYSITVECTPTAYKCEVWKTATMSKSFCWFHVTYDEDGTLFGGCSCGVPNTDGIPCQHMVAVVKSYKIDGLNETNVMPIWWHTSHWRKQYPFMATSTSNFDIQSLRHVDSTKVESSYALCPPYAGPKKAGRPREEKQIKGAVEIVMDNKKMKANKEKGQPVEPEIALEYKAIKKRTAKGRGKDAHVLSKKKMRTKK